MICVVKQPLLINFLHLLFLFFFLMVSKFMFSFHFFQVIFFSFIVSLSSICSISNIPSSCFNLPLFFNFMLFLCTSLINFDHICRTFFNDERIFHILRWSIREILSIIFILLYIFIFLFFPLLYGFFLFFIKNFNFFFLFPLFCFSYIFFKIFICVHGTFKRCSMAYFFTYNSILYVS